MKIIENPLPGVFLLEPRVFGDQRGFFLEMFHREKFHEIGIDPQFVQINHSRSRMNVLRGLHFQVEYAQGKLVYVPNGSVYDVAVDINPESETFGQYYGTELNDENHRFLYIPPGYAHGFCVLSETVDFIYQCTEFYHPEDEGGIIWNDETLGIPWPITKAEAIVSEKDTLLPTFNEYFSIK